jgi:translation initiation factor IF-3
LVQVDGAAEPPVCRLLDFDRFRYEERQREKDGRRRAVERRKSEVTKEVRLSLRTADHDLRVKAAQAARALEAGHRAKVVVLFAKGGGHRDAGGDAAAKAHAAALLDALRTAVQDEAGGPDAPLLARLDAPPKMEGSTMMWCRLAPASAHSHGQGSGGGGATKEKRPRDGAGAAAAVVPPAGAAGAAGAAHRGKEERGGGGTARRPPAGAEGPALEATVVVVSRPPRAAAATQAVE